MDITRIGIDLAKQVFQIHGVDRDGRPVVKKQLRRSQMIAYFSKLPPTLIGMEACGSAHYWARDRVRQYYARQHIPSPECPP